MALDTAVMERYRFAKTPRYYNLVNETITSLVPEGPNVVLDIGCANGLLAKRLRESNKAKVVVGVEVFDAAANEAAKYCDKVHRGDIEILDLPYEDHFDLVICGDVLEHLKDPWAILTKIGQWLKPDGRVISSVPNIRYWRVVRDLVIHDQWEYRQDGILDNSHLRWFTRKTIIAALKQADYTVLYQKMVVHGNRQSLFDALTLGAFSGFMASQIITIARRAK